MADILLMRTTNGEIYRVKLQATQMTVKNANQLILYANFELMLRILNEIDRWKFGTSIGYDKVEGYKAKVAKT
jgi:hypothetical protein